MVRGRRGRVKNGTMSANGTKQTSRHPGIRLQQARGLADDCLKPLTSWDDGIDFIDALTCVERHSLEVTRH